MEIEDRKEAEKALRDSEEKYRELANSLPQIVFETDEQGNLTFTNRNANKLFGYTEKDFSEGLNNFQILISEDQDSTSADIQEILTAS
jgi:PAS domain S-box-containing protein